MLVDRCFTALPLKMQMDLDFISRSSKWEDLYFRIYHPQVSFNFRPFDVWERERRQTKPRNQACTTNRFIELTNRSTKRVYSLIFHEKTSDIPGFPGWRLDENRRRGRRKWRRDRTPDKSRKLSKTHGHANSWKSSLPEGKPLHGNWMTTLVYN